MGTSLFTNKCLVKRMYKLTSVQQAYIGEALALRD